MELFLPPQSRAMSTPEPDTQGAKVAQLRVNRHRQAIRRQQEEQKQAQRSSSARRYRPLRTTGNDPVVVARSTSVPPRRIDPSTLPRSRNPYPNPKPAAPVKKLVGSTTPTPVHRRRHASPVVKKKTEVVRFSARIPESLKGARVERLRRERARQAEQEVGKQAPETSPPRPADASQQSTPQRKSQPLSQQQQQQQQRSTPPRTPLRISEPAHQRPPQQTQPRTAELAQRTPEPAQQPMPQPTDKPTPPLSNSPAAPLPSSSAQTSAVSSNPRAAPAWRTRKPAAPTGVPVKRSLEPFDEDQNSGGSSNDSSDSDSEEVYEYKDSEEEDVLADLGSQPPKTPTRVQLQAQQNETAHSSLPDFSRLFGDGKANAVVESGGEEDIQPESLLPSIEALVEVPSFHNYRGPSKDRRRASSFSLSEPGSMERPSPGPSQQQVPPSPRADILLPPPGSPPQLPSSTQLRIDTSLSAGAKTTKSLVAAALHPSPRHEDGGTEVSEEDYTTSFSARITTPGRNGGDGTAVDENTEFDDLPLVFNAEDFSYGRDEALVSGQGQREDEGLAEGGPAPLPDGLQGTDAGASPEDDGTSDSSSSDAGPEPFRGLHPLSMDLPLPVLAEHPARKAVRRKKAAPAQLLTEGKYTTPSESKQPTAAEAASPSTPGTRTGSEFFFPREDGDTTDGRLPISLQNIAADILNAVEEIATRDPPLRLPHPRK